MGVKANKCVYYKKSNSSYTSCCIDDTTRPCLVLLGQNCKNFYLSAKYDRDLELYEREQNQKQNGLMDEVRETLWTYKKDNKLSDLSLQLYIGVSSGTIWNFLHNKQIKASNYKLIENFAKKIRRKNV